MESMGICTAPYAIRGGTECQITGSVEPMGQIPISMTTRPAERVVARMTTSAGRLLRISSRYSAGNLAAKSHRQILSTSSMIRPRMERLSTNQPKPIREGGTQAMSSTGLGETDPARWRTTRAQTARSILEVAMAIGERQVLIRRQRPQKLSLFRSYPSSRSEESDMPLGT